MGKRFTLIGDDFKSDFKLDGFCDSMHNQVQEDNLFYSSRCDSD